MMTEFFILQQFVTKWWWDSAAGRPAKWFLDCNNNNNPSLKKRPGNNMIVGQFDFGELTKQPIFYWMTLAKYSHVMIGALLHGSILKIPTAL
jgi:hypothetical protein